MNDFLNDYGPPLGRILIAALFVISGFDKLMDTGGTAGYIASQGLPMPQVLVWVAIIIELLGGLMLVVGYKVRAAVLVLFLFTIVATVVFHPWWADPSQQNDFLKNVAILGGLLYVAAHGAGKLAMDKEEELSL
jgi:putative oxidoreductase